MSIDKGTGLVEGFQIKIAMDDVIVRNEATKQYFNYRDCFVSLAMTLGCNDN